MDVPYTPEAITVLIHKLCDNRMNIPMLEWKEFNMSMYDQIIKRTSFFFLRTTPSFSSRCGAVNALNYIAKGQSGGWCTGPAPMRICDVHDLIDHDHVRTVCVYVYVYN